MRVYYETLLMAALCLLCYIRSHAIDINIPGADPTISKEAYQNYRKTDLDVHKMEHEVEAEIKDYMPKAVVGNGDIDLDRVIYSNRELNHSLNFLQQYLF